MTFLLMIPLMGKGFSQEIIYYNIFHNGASISFLNVLGSPAPPMAQEIALRILKQPFAPEKIKSEYYQISVNQGIVWQGKNVVQYDYTPIIPDRFRHVLWVLPESSEIVKLEIYDTEDQMVFCAICLECNNLNTIRERQARRAQRQEKVENREIYNGFSVVSTSRTRCGNIRTSYSDGLNRFSIFKMPVSVQKNTEPEKFVVYGNYVFNQDLNGFRYTVVGSIPFDKMTRMIQKIGENSEE